MRSGGNNFNDFLKNQLTRMTNLVQFKCVIWRIAPPSLCVRHCGGVNVKHLKNLEHRWSRCI